MTGVVPCSAFVLHNEAAFETCLAGALRIVASPEFSGLLGEERPPRELLQMVLSLEEGGGPA